MIEKEYGLSFISDKDLFNHVKDTVENYSFTMDLKKFNSNLIDPVKLTFDSIVYSQSIKETVENEVLRQLDKTNSNLIGYFHQNIFKYFGNGWTVPPTGYDIVSLGKKIYVELKNKHNTMNSSSSAKTYMKMLHTLVSDASAECYLVEVIAKKSQNIDWVVTLDGVKQKANSRIRRISLDQFYDIVTEEKESFRKLCEVLPRVIKEVVKDVGASTKSNTVFPELESISKDLLESIYLMSFKHYEGFPKIKLEK